MPAQVRPAPSGTDADQLDAEAAERRIALNPGGTNYGSQRRKITLPAEVTAWLNKEIPE